MLLNGFAVFGYKVNDYANFSTFHRFNKNISALAFPSHFETLSS